MVAQANAKAQELQKASLTQDLLELKRIEMWNTKWDGALPQMVTSGSGMLIQMPAPKGSKATKTQDSGTN